MRISYISLLIFFLKMKVFKITLQQSFQNIVSFKVLLFGKGIIGSSVNFEAFQNGIQNQLFRTKGVIFRFILKFLSKID